MSCRCQRCGRFYQADLDVSDSIWEHIKPQGKPEGAGLLCGSCIMKSVEDLFGYSVWKLVRISTKEEKMSDSGGIVVSSSGDIIGMVVMAEDGMAVVSKVEHLLTQLKLETQSEGCVLGRACLPSSKDCIKLITAGRKPKFPLCTERSESGKERRVE